ncbi:hypothetical protein [Paenibacillus sp. GCM10012306]|uniref:hypothetical protein n=1 Tax=Paenibacillus sp. GCM10012306 TaxID=3317342 RepID=UPI00361A6BF4
MELFQSLIDDPDAVLPYVKIGQTIHVKLNEQEAVPDSYELLDYLLTEQATLKYKQSEPGNVLRGLRLVCKWKNTTQEMAFIIRTDDGCHLTLPS